MPGLHHYLTALTRNLPQQGKRPSHGARRAANRALRTASDSPTLIPEQVAESCHLLSDRIHLRLPDRGLDRHAQWLARHADEIAAAGSQNIAAPIAFRIVSWAGGIAVGGLLLSPIYFVRRLDGLDHLTVFLQSLDALFTVLAATVAAFFTMRSIELGFVRQRAIAGLQVLRSFAHVTDMLQINKSPAHIMFPWDASSGPGQTPSATEDDAGSLSHYLTYCSELYALITKLAVLYAEWTSDAEVLGAIDDVENLCTGLERKTTQKILLLEQMNQRLRPPGNS